MVTPFAQRPSAGALPFPEGRRDNPTAGDAQHEQFRRSDSIDDAGPVAQVVVSETCRLENALSHPAERHGEPTDREWRNDKNDQRRFRARLTECPLCSASSPGTAITSPPKGG
jgi:hypothetical protein